MGRVTAPEVKEILKTNLSDPTIDVFINMANLTVTEVLGDDTTLSDDQKKEIERCFTAHIIGCTKQRQKQSEKLGEATVVYHGQTGKGLDATLYGQMVKTLDTTGKMAAKLGKKAVMVHAVTSFE